ncbi:MAG TPA: TIR domain-containing protein [Caulobacteraceae bacterium]|jgi:adenylate cyclase|nr:TIR domain-containing protein [Caulobacteraceae bacterium]
MADVFVSYARADRERVRPLVKALESEGFSVWWDPEIAPGQEFDRLIAEELRRAKAAVVVWTPTSVNSRWVRGEAREAADRGILAPVRFEKADLPLDLRAIHTTDLDGWNDDAGGPVFGELARAIRHLFGDKTDGPVATTARQLAICVLPFANLSGDPEQAYFSDGISEDIITDLSKVSALYITARNTAFQFKGKSLDVPQLARQLNVSHVVEGSVRKAGNRVRITAQLIDGKGGGHIWADRWDRDLTDIFALQDEISQAIVAALKLKLLPEEKQAIEKRGTSSPEAYNLYLMARGYLESGNIGDPRREEAIIRLMRRATDLDPGYARAWALMARAQNTLAVNRGRGGDNGLAAAERAIALDPDLAEGHAHKSQVLWALGQKDEAKVESDLALKLDPDGYDANRAAANIAYEGQQFEDAIRYFAKASAGSENDFASTAMALSASQAIGDAEGANAFAKQTLERAERILAQDRGNGLAMGFGVLALATLGQADRAKEWMGRALVIDPENMVMRYNFACMTTHFLNDLDGAVELLRPVIVNEPRLLRAAKVDPDLAGLHDDPRFQAMIAEAEARFAAEPSG